LPEGLRLRRRGNWVFAFNYSNQPQAVPAPPGARFVLGGPTVAPYDLAIWVEE